MAFYRQYTILIVQNGQELQNKGKRSDLSTPNPKTNQTHYPTTKIMADKKEKRKEDKIGVHHTCPYCGTEIPNGLWNYCEHNKICDHSIKKPEHPKRYTILASEQTITNLERACKDFITPQCKDIKQKKSDNYNGFKRQH